MNRKKFREELISFCETGGLVISYDRFAVGINRNDYYYIFNFYSSGYFGLRTHNTLYPDTLDKCYDWSEASLERCKKIALYWIGRNKYSKMTSKISKLREDFE
jgi:hypothetical protein